MIRALPFSPAVLIADTIAPQSSPWVVAGVVALGLIDLARLYLSRPARKPPTKPKHKPIRKS